MNELQALLSPTSLPCNTVTDPADVQFALLQLTVVNTSQTAADLTNSGLRIEFVVDPGGSGSAGALILSQYSNGQNASGPPAPSFGVEASAASGTAWTITQTQDAPCAFIAIPDTGAGLLTASPGSGQPGGSISFVFANIAADLVPGASSVTVTVLPGSSVTVANTPLIAKTAPALGAWLVANPQLLIPPGNQTLLTWTTIGAASCELGWDQGSTVVGYNGQAMPNPWTASSTPPPPVQVTAAAPVTATVFREEQFTLTAQGGAQVPSVQVVTIVPPSFTASANTAVPFVPFTLYWSCYDGTSPSLTWDSSGVSVTSSSGNAINSGDPVNLSDTATVLITHTTPGNAAINFTLHAPPGDSPATVQVSLEPVTLNNFTVSNLIVDPNSPIGQQIVTLTWTAQNATGFTIDYGPNGTPVNLDYTTSSYPMRLPQYPQGPVTYTITAHGYATSGTEPTGQQTVEPLRVQTPGFGASPPQVSRGQNVRLSWNADAATGYTVSFSGGSPTSLLANVFAISLPAWFIPTSTYTIIAHGYTAGGPEPSATVSVTVTKPKEKEKEKELHIPKEAKDGKEKEALEPVFPSRSLSAGSRSAAGLPSGTQQPFIYSGERPDVGGHLQSTGSSAPAEADE
jgi:hypothetical protein